MFIVLVMLFERSFLILMLWCEVLFLLFGVCRIFWWSL